MHGGEGERGHRCVGSSPPRRTSPDGVWDVTDVLGDWVEEQIGTRMTGVSDYESHRSPALRRVAVVAMTLEDETATTIMTTHADSKAGRPRRSPQRGFASAPSIAVSDTGVWVAYREQGRRTTTRSFPTKASTSRATSAARGTPSGSRWKAPTRVRRCRSIRPPSGPSSPSGHAPSPTCSPAAPISRTAGQRVGRTQRSVSRGLPSLRISDSGRRYVLLSDAMSTHLSYGSARPGHDSHGARSATAFRGPSSSLGAW